jgi:flagellar biosynthesis chaperone FliJ
MKSSARQGTTAMQLKLCQYRLDAIRYEEEEIKEYLKLLEVKIEKQRQVVILMSQEVEGLNKLEEKARNEYIEQQKKETENTLGEFISTKLGAKKITQKY